MNRWTSVKTITSHASAKQAGPSYTAGQQVVQQAAQQAPARGDWPAHCDPYLVWADLSNWRGFARAGNGEWNKGPDPRVCVLMRAPSHAALVKLAASKLVSIPAAYLKGVPGSSKPAEGRRFATGHVHRSDLRQLLTDHPEVDFELGAPLRDQGNPLFGDAKGYHGQQTELDIPPPGDVFADTKPAARTASKTLYGTMAVFDYGCPFLRREFDLGHGPGTRIRALWHQEHFAAVAPWTQPSSFGYGREMRAPMLTKLRTQALAPGASFDEARAYRGLNYLIDYSDPRRRVHLATHGAHVLDVAGGQDDPALGASGGAERDAASRASLVFVHMPEDTAGDSSGASLGVYLLDALRYMLEVAHPEEPLVINVSYGSTAGPHNGSSIIEQAMDDLLAQRPKQFAIVLAAGNSRRLGLHTSRVASLSAMPKSKAPGSTGSRRIPRTALFRIDVAAGDHTDTFIEFWYDAVDTAPLNFRARVPDGDWSPWVGPNARVDLRSDTGQEVIAALIARTKVPNGDRAMALLALRPTEAPDDDDGALAEPGFWEVEVQIDPRAVHASDDASLSARIDAWIRRDDSRPFSGRVQSSFVGLEPEDTENTLSNIASGQHTVVVGGFRWSDGMAAGYSSIGPRSSPQWPMVYGMCERDSVDPGIRAAAVRSQETLLMNGTSVAAPVVARRIFNLMVAAAAKGRPLDKPKMQKALLKEAQRRGSLIRMNDAPV